MNDPSVARRPCTASDLVIEELTGRVSSLTAEARELASDLEVYRTMQHLSLTETARLVRLVKTQSVTIQLLRDELRRFTGTIVLGRAA